MPIPNADRGVDTPVWTLYSISTYSEDAAGGSANARARVAAICPRVTGSVGQYRAGPVPQPDTIPRSPASAHGEPTTHRNPRQETPTQLSTVQNQSTARLAHTASTHRGNGPSQQPRPHIWYPPPHPPLESIHRRPTRTVTTLTRAADLCQNQRSRHNHQDNRREPPNPHSSHPHTLPTTGTEHGRIRVGANRELYAAVVDVVDDPAVVDVVDDAGVANVWGGVQGEYPALLWDRT